MTCALNEVGLVIGSRQGVWGKDSVGLSVTTKGMEPILKTPVDRGSLRYNNNNNNNNIFSLIKRLTNALCCTFTCYAIETILTS